MSDSTSNKVHGGVFMEEISSRVDDLEWKSEQTTFVEKE